MTVRKLERITLLTYISTPVDSKTLRHCLVDQDGNVVVSISSSRDLKASLTLLLAANYRRVSLIVFERAGWKCEDCRRIRPLQYHHRQFRSQGRIDTVENGRALCSDCHEKRHRGKHHAESE